MITRIIADEIGKSKKSVLLLGPRQAGKSTLVESLRPDLVINLAEETEFLRHSSNPGLITQLVAMEQPRVVFIDEVQRLPSLLNTVQALVDHNKKLKFLLTGSSARKLKRGGANLLPGRVLNYRLGPLVAAEMQYKFDSLRALSLGTLPEPYLASNTDGRKILTSYAANYLKEEIKAEALTRNLESFARFLNEAALAVGQFIDLSKLARTAKISRHAVPRYFEILEDTLVGSRVFAYAPLVESQDLIRHPKFYLFDNGVYNGMMTNFSTGPDRVGALAEQLIFSQLHHSAWARNTEAKISTFRTRSGIEVDFVVEIEGKITAVEVKSSDQIAPSDCDGLMHFKKFAPSGSDCLILHLGVKEQKIGPCWSLPWQKGLMQMGL